MSGRQRAPPGAAAFPTDTGNGLFPRKPSAWQLAPDGLAHGFPQKVQPGTQPAESCPALRGQRIQKGLLVRGSQRKYPKGPEFTRADTQYEVNDISGKIHRLCPKKTSQARMASHGCPGKLRSLCHSLGGCSARPLQALQHGAEPWEHGAGLEGEAIMLHH